jgi:hypothetical protein
MTDGLIRPNARGASRGARKLQAPNGHDGVNVSTAAPGVRSSLPAAINGRAQGLDESRQSCFVITTRIPCSRWKTGMRGNRAAAKLPRNLDYVALLAPTERATPRISTRDDISREFP